MLDYKPEQLWLLYEKLPKDLQRAIFSEETAETIYELCTKNGLEKEMPKIAKYTGYVLLGLLFPNELEKTLKSELKIEDNLAKKISWEINRFIFFPVKENLEMLYNIKIEKPSALKEEMPVSTEKPVKDIYREPIE